MSEEIREGGVADFYAKHSELKEVLANVLLK
jgi:hypothetical protein